MLICGLESWFKSCPIGSNYNLCKSSFSPNKYPWAVEYRASESIQLLIVSADLVVVSVGEPNSFYIFRLLYTPASYCQ